MLSIKVVPIIRSKGYYRERFSYIDFLIEMCFLPKIHTLIYRISMPAGINMPDGAFDKINKHASWKIIL